jgi:predicted HD superfamily hydrolase involved in NAD metabolism
VATSLLSAIEPHLQRLPKGLRDHVERTREVARELALRHGVDVERTDLGVAAHDLARALKGDALLDQARHYGLRLHHVEQHAPLLLHGPVAALWLEREHGVADGEVLEAVRWHTTGRRGMSRLARVVFLADKLDPEKVERNPRLERVRLLATESLDRAILEYLNIELEHLLREGRLIHPEAIELRNELLTD